MNKNDYYCFTIKEDVSIDEAWSELACHSVEIAFGSEEENTRCIYGYWPQGLLLPRLATIKAANLAVVPSIDWEEQWALHGQDFHEGCVQLDLSQYSSCKSILRLVPGPGFGDLSHPTTRLVLKMMPKHTTPGCRVWDIGCGSGVLSLAAATLGAAFVTGIDIDSEAIDHSYRNAKLNNLEGICRFVLPHEVPEIAPSLVLMNMILSDQMKAYDALPQLQRLTNACCITSGIRQEGYDDYVRMVDSWGWKVIECQEEVGWLGFCLHTKIIP